MSDANDLLPFGTAVVRTNPSVGGHLPVLVRAVQDATDPPLLVGGGGAGGGIAVEPVNSTTGTQSSVANTGASQTLLASNVNRLGVSIYNDPAGGAGSDLYIRTNAAAATTSNFTIVVPPKGYYEVPFGYIGAITAISIAALGVARITEYTP